MILNCPRCGFSQPEDQYCAQCGVNMQSFRPAEKSFVKKLSENILLQVLGLILIAGLGGSYIIQSGTSPKWMQKITRSQGVSKSTRPVSTAANSAEQVNDYSTTSQPDSLESIKNKEIVFERSGPPPTVVSLQAETEIAVRATESKDAVADSSVVSFQLTYAEVSVEILARWIAESSRLGLYQNLQDYSAGILPDFKKRNDPIQTVLKTLTKKLSVGQVETFLSGSVADDGQMVGLNASLEMKSLETAGVQGSLTITRASRASRENYPAEFELGKGAAFFVVDTINRQSFPNEKESLGMPPFQILKSPDFMAQKTKFVILLEPEIK